MEQDCVVFGCRNSSIFQAKKNDCNFFNFPLDQPKLLNKWLKKLNLETWNPGPENVICEEHFSFEAFDIVNDKRVLRTDAVPSMIDDWRRVINNDISVSSVGSFNDNNENLEFSEDLRCRICASFLSTENAVDIYSKDDNVMEKMMACIPILVKTADSLPKHICRLCLIDLNISYRMLVRAIESEKLFNNLLTKSPLKSPQNNEEIIEKLDDTEKSASTCVICNVHYDNVNDLGNHFQEKHVDEFDFNDHNIIEKPPESIERDEFHDDLLEFVDEKESVDEIKDDECMDMEDDQEDQDNESDHSMSGKIQYLICQFCMQIFYTVDELNDHLESHIESLVCDICGCLCQDHEKLKTHRETHIKRTVKNNTCPICFTVFLTHNEMLAHSKEAHFFKDTKDDTFSQKWICKYCGKEIATKLSLSIHERIHTGVRPYVCECCGRSFKSKANLIQHQPVHTGIKRYKCSVCDKAFARKAFVTTHMRVHTGERPFECEICGNRYTQIGDMRRHKKRHSINDVTDPAIKQITIQTDPDRTIAIQDDLVEEDKTETNVDQGTAMFENNGLIKLHFAKDVTDFRRILVELQQ